MKLWQLKEEKSYMKAINYLEHLLILLAFFWLLVFALSLPSPISWLVLGNTTLLIMIYIELKGGK